MMTIRTPKIWRLGLAVAAGALCLLANDNISLTKPSSLVTQADARVGRPLTPMSAAGVARRTTRRAVAGAAVVGATAGAAYYGSNYYRTSPSDCYRDAVGVVVCP
jgi:hypothetical protein